MYLYFLKTGAVYRLRRHHVRTSVMVFILQASLSLELSVLSQEENRGKSFFLILKAIKIIKIIFMDIQKTKVKNCHVYFSSFGFIHFQYLRLNMFSVNTNEAEFVNV